MSGTYFLGGIKMLFDSFRYGWRYTEEECSKEELESIRIVSENISKTKWEELCDNVIIEKSSYIQKILSKKLQVLIADCCWGEENEKLSGAKFREYFDEEEEIITILYDYESAIEIPASFFYEKWFVFCYPSDSSLIICGNLSLFYYEDTVYII